jgi:putative DNA primase/helicase
VLIINPEDGPDDTIKPRLEAAGADCTRVHMIEAAVDPETGRRTSRQFGLHELELIIERAKNMEDLKLVIIDPIGSNLGAGTDQNSEISIREALEPLKTLAEKRNIAVVIIAHTRKMEAERADDMVMGSKAFTGLARAVFHLMFDPEDPARRLLVPGKFNLGSEPTGLAFTLNPTAPGALAPSLCWDPTPLNLTADAVLDMRRKGSQQQRGPSAVEIAKNWLEAQLADGPRRSAELAEAAKANEISDSTYHRARRELKLEVTQREREWWTSLPTPPALSDVQTTLS